jgi:hypothetical protein
MKDVANVTGLKMPRRVFLRSIWSSTSVVPTRSDLTRAMARSFSS